MKRFRELQTSRWKLENFLYTIKVTNENYVTTTSNKGPTRKLGKDEVPFYSKHTIRFDYLYKSDNTIGKLKTITKPHTKNVLFYGCYIHGRLPMALYGKSFVLTTMMFASRETRPRQKRGTKIIKIRNPEDEPTAVDDHGRSAVSPTKRNQRLMATRPVVPLTLYAKWCQRKCALKTWHRCARQKPNIFLSGPPTIEIGRRWWNEPKSRNKSSFFVVIYAYASND